MLSFTSIGIESWPELESVLSKALSKNAEERFADVKEFSAALERLKLKTRLSVPQSHLADVESFLSENIDRILEQGWEFKVEKSPRISVNIGLAALHTVFIGSQSIAVAQICYILRI